MPGHRVDDLVGDICPGNGLGLRHHTDDRAVRSRMASALLVTVLAVTGACATPGHG